VFADKFRSDQITKGSFNGYGGLAATDNQIYIMDSLNPRLQTMFIESLVMITRKYDGFM
jgi:hypothetical protein